MPKIPCSYHILKYISGQVPETAGKEKGTPCLYGRTSLMEEKRTVLLFRIDAIRG